MSQLQLYFDDSGLGVQCTPSNAWADNSSELWTSGHSKLVNQFPGANFQFTFNGTGANFYGAALNNSEFIPIINNVPQPSIALPGSNPPSYGAWYQTPPLPPGEHTVVINNVPKLTLDYIIVDVDPTTDLQHMPILVSDSDPLIKYIGDWKKNFESFLSLEPFMFIGDYSTRSTCNPGDSLSLGFSGSSISLWGVFDWKSVGSVSAAYYIDGGFDAQKPYEATVTSQNSIYGVQTNFLLYEKGGLTSGPHTITVNITDCTNQRFALDYITYIPSFASGNDAPATSGTPNDSSTPSHFPTGAIAGIVVGVVVLAAAAGFILWYCRRRRTAAEPFSASSSSSPVARKEELPAHMRHLRSPPSRDTFPTDTLDLTNGSTSNRAWVIAPHPSEFRNIDEVVAAAPPPAYPNHHRVDSEPFTATTGRGP